ncbi:MAG: hypothetical protein MZV65_03715 [Chromatiales bacterium]|nr:hypothetical protein [Chromatiales bacterium]
MPLQRVCISLAQQAHQKLCHHFQDEPHNVQNKKPGQNIFGKQLIIYGRLMLLMTAAIT